ncbi:MAG: DUF3179 domain-containing protein [bacterium]|nr:DUF3179 domain-containing protein [bacterium]MCP4968346.1 DUF3179 domain-containing protein [bacterium]
MVHRRELNGEEIVLGNQGALWGSAMTWWDHETGSIWSQPIGEAIAGPLKGEHLELLASTLTTWDAWRTAHPETQALDIEGWRTAFDLSDMAVVVDLGTESTAYDIPALRQVGVVNDQVAGVDIAVVIDPNEDSRWVVFSRRLDDAVVDLDLTAEGLVDRDTGSVFDPFLGVGRSGPLGDQTLDRLPAFTSFPEDYFTFFPEGTLWP